MIQKQQKQNHFQFSHSKKIILIKLDSNLTALGEVSAMKCHILFKREITRKKWSHSVSIKQEALDPYHGSHHSHKNVSTNN